jgi:hypothetical protein
MVLQECPSITTNVAEALLASPGARFPHPRRGCCRRRGRAECGTGRRRRLSVGGAERFVGYRRRHGAWARASLVVPVAYAAYLFPFSHRYLSLSFCLRFAARHLGPARNLPDGAADAYGRVLAAGAVAPPVPMRTTMPTDRSTTPAGTTTSANTASGGGSALLIGGLSVVLAAGGGVGWYQLGKRRRPAPEAARLAPITVRLAPRLPVAPLAFPPAGYPPAGPGQNSRLWFCPRPGPRSRSGSRPCCPARPGGHRGSNPHRSTCGGSRARRWTPAKSRQPRRRPHRVGTRTRPGLRTWRSTRIQRRTASRPLASGESRSNRTARATRRKSG